MADKTLLGGAVAGTVIGGIVALSMQFIEPHEGRVYRTYVDPAGVNTVCVGNTSAAIPGETYTDEECSLLLIADLVPVIVAVGKLVKVPMSDEQTVATVSFVFNVGVGAFSRSTLLRKLNAGDYEGAAAEFERWVNAGGQRLPGLVVRRARESRLFMGSAPA